MYTLQPLNFFFLFCSLHNYIHNMSLNFFVFWVLFFQDDDPNSCYGLKQKLYTHWLDVYCRSGGNDFHSSRERLFFSLCESPVWLALATCYCNGLIYIIKFFMSPLNSHYLNSCCDFNFFIGAGGVQSPNFVPKKRLDNCATVEF